MENASRCRPPARRPPLDMSWGHHIVRAPEIDWMEWMEWQAAYIGEALLLPHHSVRLRVREIAMLEVKEPPVEAESDLR